MPLLDHFHPPLHGPRRWEGFLHDWATFLAKQLNGILPPGYFAEPAISKTICFTRLDGCEIRVYQDDGGGAQLRAAIELISPANKDREGSRHTFAAKCADYLQHGIGLAIVDVVTSRTANLHADLFSVLEVSSKKLVWESKTGLYAVAYRPVVLRKSPRVEAWPTTLEVGQTLPDLPLWLSLEFCLPVRLEASYRETCESLRISA